MIEWSASLKDWVIRNSELDNLFEVQELKGATSSLLYLLSDSGQKKAVIRFYTNHEWLKEEPDLAKHEASSLIQADTSEINTPKLYAYTFKKEISPYPAVLMSYIPGEVMLPKHPKQKWLKGLATLLGTFHRTEINDPFPWHHKTYNDIHLITNPTWSKYESLFIEAIQFAKNYHPSSNIGFIHRDFHPVNVLWEKGEATGIVDWPNACWGPKEVDVGHCRLNLALLYGIEAADHFLKFYIEETKTLTADQPYWDLITMFDFLPEPNVYPPWLELGMNHLTEGLIKSRYDSYFLSIHRSIVKK
ncbi:aminoglycoside phosphotransferase family protein [Fictibacillus nanhaiensis]|uniref:aminoglycoside phosphotransferase family protein n=1 Tax=Fictibacillus nanhaiensis TaxID=742169 RepID=UPI001C95DD24|nr:aminoglycoside phosphotransferase family protein [Fictibacillus nanhaiensis]MBY6035861.1 aminoglycoside phosphotransferase family protein [Fictibacillus nanhaiensis]